MIDFEGVACPPLVFGIDAIMANFISMEYKFMDSVAFECMVGFEYYSGSDNRTCQADATWSGAPYICTRKFSFNTHSFLIRVTKQHIVLNGLVTTRNSCHIYVYI